ncbi:hypothetical protein JX265_003577 [Neoarthrinium moseri]|uniref:Efflux pump antibiotic resistance protein n=1 Tax=Neoarthrinium moseri TaxID=1658444 RepID=A0A9P9WSG3_9PEZI|nr:hypothetical protein JX265_003577 [Neoarthrinium moseri]
MDEREASSRNDGLVVIHVALFRMATASLAEAYRILGYKVHHGLEDTLGMPWTQLEHAAEATWPTAAGAHPRPRRTRCDWDNLWGSHYDIATDMASPFADQLIEAYPNAKVVVIQREFDAWWASYRSELLDTLFSPVQQVVVFLLSHVMGIRAGDDMRKIHFGFFAAQNRAEIEANARQGYDRYYKKVRQMVPPEKRLEYCLGDGWEPLCAFLGKEIPKVPFPRKNTRASHNKGEMGRKWTIFTSSAKIAAPWALSAIAAAGIAWYVHGSW